MCYFRVARCLADYREWLQFCWNFVKPPRNDEIALQHFSFLACSSARFLFLFRLCCMQFFSSNKSLQEIFFQNHPPPPPPILRELNGRDGRALTIKLAGDRVRLIEVKFTVNMRSNFREIDR